MVMVEAKNLSRKTSPENSVYKKEACKQIYFISRDFFRAVRNMQHYSLKINCKTTFSNYSTVYIKWKRLKEHRLLKQAEVQCECVTKSYRVLTLHRCTRKMTEYMLHVYMNAFWCRWKLPNFVGIRGSAIPFLESMGQHYPFPELK